MILLREHLICGQVRNFSSQLQNPTVNGADADDAGDYYVRIVLDGCIGPADTTTVIITTVGTPVAGSNSPLCAGDDLLLTASDIPDATYTWTGLMHIPQVFKIN